jgi:hypothetical protein
VHAALVKALELPDESIIITQQHGSTQAAVVEVAVGEQDEDSFAGLRYSMTDPHLRFACCTCESALQDRPCKHQLSVLMRLFPGKDAMLKIAYFLGTRLGMQGGCKRDASGMQAGPLRHRCVATFA